MERPEAPTAGPGWFKSAIASVLDYVDANRPVSGLGTMVFDVAGGRAVNAAAGGGGGGATAAGTFPFQVTLRNNGTAESPSWQWKVALDSSLFKSLRPNDKQAITGLDAWFPAIATDAIWLGIVVDSAGAITAAQIDSWGQGDSFDITADAWSGENGYCEDDGGDPAVHQTSRKLIAYSVAGDGGEPVLTQVTSRDQLLRNICIDGRPARYPFAHEGGYPL